jgi:SAM-dependent methyltransferase
MRAQLVKLARGTSMTDVVQAPPSSKEQLRELILESLQRKYTARSCHEEIKTGNHYQSVRLGNERTEGFRTDRAEFLDRVDFRGRTVLDLGSNLGEISRSARARGARLVDGFEYDPFFIEIARMVNAYNDVTRVSFYQRDITDPSIYRERYDIVCAFAVFIYIEPVLDHLAEITDEVLIVETHRLNDNLERRFIRPIEQYFPHYKILGETEWGVRGERARSVRRAVVAFARDEATLDRVIDPPTAAPPSVEGPAQTLPPRLEVTRQPPEPGVEPQLRLIDVERSSGHVSFFSAFRFDTPDELLAAISGMQLDVPTLARDQDLRRGLYRGPLYWLLYLKGYTQYVETGTIGAGNAYFDYLVEQPGVHERNPALGLNDRLRALEIVVRRFRDFDTFRQAAREGWTPPPGIAPLEVVEATGEGAKWIKIFEAGEGAGRPVRHMDGHHRLFQARLWGIPQLQARLMSDEGSPAPMAGGVDELTIADGRLSMRGWALPREAAQSVSVRCAGRWVANGLLTASPEVASRFPGIAHAGRAGFTVDAPAELESDGMMQMEVVAMLGLTELGVIPVCHLPGAPPTLAGTVTLLHHMLAAARAAGADKPDVILVTERTAGASDVLESLAPGARVAVADTSESVPDGPFDLVLATAEPERARLSELARALRTGGHLVVAVDGELMRTYGSSEAHTTRQEAQLRYGRRLAVAEHVVGGAGDGRDLVITRKA